MVESGKGVIELGFCDPEEKTLLNANLSGHAGEGIDYILQLFLTYSRQISNKAISYSFTRLSWEIHKDFVLRSFTQ